MSRSSGPQTVLSRLAAHPYLWTLGACLFFQPLILLSGEQNTANYAVWLLMLMAVGTAAAFGLYVYQPGRTESSRPVLKAGSPRLVIFALSAVLAVCFLIRVCLQSQNQGSSGVWAVLIAAAFVLATLFVLRDCTAAAKNPEQINALMIISLGFFLKLFYICITSVYTRQHDVGAFEDNTFHTGYIEYLLTRHQLPDFDVRNYWQFYHPPLHHAIGAAWIFLNENILLIGHDAARESLQTLTLFYSMCIIVSAYRILRCFRLKGWALYIPLIIISFHPTFILFSGSINNDVLSAAFIMGAVLSTLEWYENQTAAGIIRIALCIGLGMMTKISAAIVAPPVALVFLLVLIRKWKTDRQKLMVQFVCFALVCMPLGLWFGIRNYVLWGVPITFVPMMRTDLPQYLGNLDFASRVTDFSWQQFTSPYMRWEQELYAQGCTEYNPLITAMKSSLFGEWKIIGEDSVLTGTFADAAPYVLFWTNAALAGFALAAMVILCCRKSSEQWTEMLFLACFYIVMMASFYKMAADYPFTSTMDFRYISPTAIVGAVFIGLFLKGKTNTRPGRILTSVVGAGAFLFAALSGFVYLAA